MIFMKMGNIRKRRGPIRRFLCQIIDCAFLLLAAVTLAPCSLTTIDSWKEWEPPQSQPLSDTIFVKGFLPRAILRRHCHISRNYNTIDNSLVETILHECNGVRTEPIHEITLLKNHTKSHSLSVCLVPPSPISPLPQLVPQTARTDINNHTNTDTNNIEDFLCGKDSDDESASNTELWRAVTRMRLELKDPGLYRWPPHVNLLYPFVRYNNDCDTEHESSPARSRDNAASNLLPILAKLRKAAKKIEPFWVVVDLSEKDNSGSTIHSTSGFGRFGSSNRGVLWVYPKSFRGANNDHSNNVNNPDATFSIAPNSTSSGIESTTVEPIVALQALLEQEFPTCGESLKKRNFIPHMTLSSKFGSLENAMEAQVNLTKRFLLDGYSQFNVSNLCYWCDEFYLLERDKKDEQFRRKATIALGDAKTSPSNENKLPTTYSNLHGVYVHDPPLPFGGMPTVEEDWIAKELLALQERRKTNRNNRPRGAKPRKSYRARRRERKNAKLAKDTSQR